MKIIIYALNSFGGNYDYAVQLFSAYKKCSEVTECLLLLPVNASLKEEGVLKILKNDLPRYKSKWLRKLYFLYRSYANPIILYRKIKFMPGVKVIFNDYDQLTAPVWCHLFNKLRYKHTYSVILHDPDRDKYLPYKAMSSFTMTKVMSVMDIAFYHGYLPDKPYYNGAFAKISVPHGIYPAVSADKYFLEELMYRKADSKLLGILGNIRDEKNYLLVMEALTSLNNVKLLIAGLPSNQAVPITRYKQTIIKRGLSDKVIWIQEYLSSTKMSAAITACDVIIMYYKSSFASQSGMLNMVAPYKKKIIVSDAESSLRDVVADFDLGMIVKAEDVNDFKRAIESLLNEENGSLDHAWNRYEDAVSWEKHVQRAMDAFRKVNIFSDVN